MGASDERMRCWAAGIRLTTVLEDLRNDLIARQGGKMMPGTETPGFYEAVLGSVKHAYEDAVACDIPGAYLPPGKFRALEEFPADAAAARSHAAIAGELGIMAEEFASKMSDRPPSGSPRANLHPETFAARLRRFTDACGEATWMGYDLGGDWNGWANVVVPEAEAERMVAEWRKGTPEADWADAGYDETSLPPVRTAIVNGKETRVRDFSYGYAFSWSDEKRPRRCGRKAG